MQLIWPVLTTAMVSQHFSSQTKSRAAAPVSSMEGVQTRAKSIVLTREAPIGASTAQCDEGRFDEKSKT